MFAPQCAKALGARVIAPTFSATKAKAPDAEVFKLTNGRGVDRVVEVGGTSTVRSIKSTNISGRVMLVGMGGKAGTISPLLMAGGNVSLQAVAVGGRRHLEDSFAAVDMHRIRPIIDRVFPFEQGKDAYRYLQSRAHVRN